MWQVSLIIMAIGLIAGIFAWADGSQGAPYIFVAFILGLLALFIGSGSAKEETEEERRKRESTLWMDEDGNFYRGGSPTGRNRRKK